MKNQLLILFLFLALAGCTGDEEPFVAKNALYETTFISEANLTPITDKTPKGTLLFVVLEFRENGRLEYLHVNQDGEILRERQTGAYALDFPRLKNIMMHGTVPMEGVVSVVDGVYVLDIGDSHYTVTTQKFD